MPLADAAARNETLREKTLRLADAGGMYLEVTLAGGKYGRMKYQFVGKEKRLALGSGGALNRCPTATKLNIRPLRAPALNERSPEFDRWQLHGTFYPEEVSTILLRHATYVAPDSIGGDMRSGRKALNYDGGGGA